jgi:hypothetical protein
MSRQSSRQRQFSDGQIEVLEMLVASKVTRQLLPGLEQAASAYRTTLAAVDAKADVRRRTARRDEMQEGQPGTIRGTVDGKHTLPFYRYSTLLAPLLVVSCGCDAGVQPPAVSPPAPAPSRPSRQSTPVERPQRPDPLQGRGFDSWIASGMFAGEDGIVHRFHYDGDPSGRSGSEPYFIAERCLRPRGMKDDGGGSSIRCAKDK